MYINFDVNKKFGFGVYIYYIKNDDFLLKVIKTEYFIISKNVDSDQFKKKFANKGLIEIFK